jgi:hypothetical protein
MAALRRRKSARGSEQAAEPRRDTATAAIPGQGRRERSSAKRRLAPWEADPENPMALWNPELGGFGGELEADSQTASDDIDIDAILRDKDAFSEGEGPDDVSDLAPVSDEGDEEATDQDSSAAAAAQVSAPAGGKGATPGDSAGGGSEEEQEERVWVPELRKMVKETNILRGGPAMYVAAEEREEEEESAASAARQEGGPSHSPAGLEGARGEEPGSQDSKPHGGAADARRDDQQAPGGVDLDKVLEADVDEFEPFLAHGIPCVLHRCVGFRV